MYVRVHEGTYIEHPSVREQRKLLAVKGDNDDEEIPLRAVPSIGELRHPSKQQEASSKRGGPPSGADLLSFRAGSAEFPRWPA